MTDLEELDIKAIFDVAFRVFLHNWQGVLLYLLALLVLTWTIQIPVVAWLGTQQALLVTGLEVFLVRSLIVGFVTSMAVLVFTPLINAYQQGVTISKRLYIDSHRQLGKYLGSVLCYGLGFVMVVMTGVGLATLLGSMSLPIVAPIMTVIAMYLLIVSSFYLYELAHTGVWGAKSLLRSYRLVKGRVFKTLLINVVGTVLTMMSVQIMAFILGQLGLSGLIGSFIGEYTALLMSAYLMLALGVWYLNRYTAHQALIDKRNHSVGQYE